MAFSADYTVMFFFFLVLALVVLPLVIALTWLIFFSVREIRKGRIPYVDHYLSSYYAYPDGLQKRRERRFHLARPLTVKISSNSDIHVGVMVNVSCRGLCIENVPEDINTSSGLKVSLETEQAKFCVDAILKWYKQGRAQKGAIGLMVGSKQKSWSQYVTALA